MEKQKIITNVIWKFAERILAQGVSLLVSIILARLLMPEDYGAIAMVTVFITVANVFVTSGIPNALIQKKDADALDFSSVFYFNFGVSVCIYLLLFLFAPAIAAFYELEILCPVVRVMGLRIVVASVNSVQHAYVSRHMMFRKYFFSTLFGTLCSGIVGIVMAYMGAGIWALVAQYMVNTTVDTIILFITVNWRPKWAFSFQRVKRLLNFGWRILFEGLSDTVVGQVQNLIIGKVYTAGDLACYTKGQQFPAVIVSNSVSSIGAVLFPAMSNVQDQKEYVLQMLKKSVRMASYIIYPVLTGLAVVAPSFVHVVLTDKWAGAIPFLQAFCLLNAPSVAMIPRHQALNALGRSDVFMYEHMIARAVSIVLLMFTYRISVWAILCGSFASTAILMAIIAFTSKRYVGYSYLDQIKDIIPTLIGCAVMGIPVYFLQFLNLPHFPMLIVQVVTGMTIYILYSAIFKVPEFQTCLSMIKRIIRKK